MDVIETKNLKVSYDKKNFALKGIDINVKKGEIFGFLGPNGAGKTTTIRVLTTLIKPTEGDVQVLGYDVKKDALSIRQRIGVVLQQPSYEWSLSVEKNLYVYGVLWNIPKNDLNKRIEQLIMDFDLNDIRKQYASDISIGQRRRLQLARELIHDSELLFVDEPTIGLDPIIKRKILDYFKNLSKNGKTIFFTTHNLEEADYICDRVAIINKGRIHVLDSVENLKRKYEKERTLEILFNDGNDLLMKKLTDRIDSIKIISPKEKGDPYKIVTDDLSTTIEIINDFIKSNSFLLQWFNIKKTELEEVFLDIIGGNKNE
ncbi:MAG: ABC transporter ATP-binding protein [Thermoplasmata archaeon]|nr:ATP-binding cassette domain-containing protein [Thermoplasmata archaeon]